MIPALDIKAYAVKIFFNFWGRLGSALLNIGCCREVDFYPGLPYGPEALQQLDIFRPKSATQKKLPVLIFFHGGGWISADKRIYKGVAATLCGSGYLTFNINYRLAPGSRFPAALQDAASAIDWVMNNLERYGGDRSCIVLGGDSAGAQIASWYASALHTPDLLSQADITDTTAGIQINGLLLFYGVYDFDTVLAARFPFINLYVKSFLGSDSQTYAANAQIASPIRHLSSHLPPVFICAGERDGLYRQSIQLAQALERLGVPCHKLFLPRVYRADHGFLFFPWLSSSRLAYAAAADYLQQVAGLARTAGGK